MGMHAAGSTDAVLMILPPPSRPCPKGKSCGLCAACRSRAREAVEQMAVQAQRRRGKSMSSPVARHHAKNRIMRMLCMLDLLPSEEYGEPDPVPAEKREEMEKWVAYCEAMHSMGLRGSVK